MTGPAFEASFIVSLPDTEELELNTHTDYEVTDFRRPTIAGWRKTTVDGDYVAGETLVNAVPAAENLSLRVRVKGTDWQNQATLAAAMVAALTQLSYTFTVTEEGVQTVWTGCQPATIAPRSGTDGEWAQSSRAYRVEKGFDEYDITIRARPGVTTVPEPEEEP